MCAIEIAWHAAGQHEFTYTLRTKIWVGIKEMYPWNCRRQLTQPCIEPCHLRIQWFRRMPAGEQRYPQCAFGAARVIVLEYRRFADQYDDMLAARKLA